MTDDTEMTSEEKEMLNLLNVEESIKEPKLDHPKPPEKPPKKAPAKKDGFSMWQWLVEMIGYNVGMIFGDTGSGKSKTCEQIAYECAKEEKKVYYIDHEANFSKKDIDTLKKAGVTYKLMTKKDDLYDLDQQKIHGFDLVIIDSATLAITGTWAKLNMQQKGSTLQQLQGMVYRLSQYCIEKKNCIVILTAQPTSLMGDKHTIQPLGDKVHYLCKEIYYIKAPRNEEGFITKRTVISFRSRSFPDGTVIAPIETQKFGVKFDVKHMEKIMKEV